MDIIAPNLGEGMRTIKVVRILKNTNDWVEEDENLLEVETDKSTVEIPAPISGRVGLILCRANEVVQVGQKLIRLEPADKNGIKINHVTHLEPRVTETACLEANHPARLPKDQHDLSKRLAVSRDIVVPATLEMRLDWEHLRKIRNNARKSEGIDFVPTTTEVLAWALTQSMLKFDKFRMRCNSTLDVMLHESALLGIAVSLPDDTLRTVVVNVPSATTLQSAYSAIRRAINAAKASNHLTEVPYHSVTLSNMAHSSIYRATPIVVHPAVATLCIGAPHQNISICSLTFDHRIMNGMYAASFLKYFVSILKRTATEGASYGSLAS